MFLSGLYLQGQKCFVTNKILFMYLKVSLTLTRESFGVKNILIQPSKNQYDLKLQNLRYMGTEITIQIFSVSYHENWKKEKPSKISILQPFSRVGLVSMFHECQIKKPLMTSSSCKRRNLKFLNPSTSSSNYELWRLLPVEEDLFAAGKLGG